MQNNNVLTYHTAITNIGKKSTELCIYLCHRRKSDMKVFNQKVFTIYVCASSFNNVSPALDMYESISSIFFADTQHELDTVQQVKEEIEELREYVDRLEEHSHRRKLRLLEQVISGFKQ